MKTSRSLAGYIIGAATCFAALSAIPAVQARSFTFVDIGCSGPPCTLAEPLAPLETVTSGLVPVISIGFNNFAVDQLTTSLALGRDEIDYSFTVLPGGLTCASVGGCQFMASAAGQIVETIGLSLEPPTTISVINTIANIPTPEPSSVFLFAAGIAICAILKFRRSPNKHGLI